MSVDICASFICTSWFRASGLPNCFRSRVYSSAVFMQDSAAPITPKAMPKRALFRQLKGPLSPLTSGNMLPPGTRTLSIMIMPVTDARSENLPSITGVVRPGMPRSSTKPRMSPAGSFAQTMNTSAMGELEIQVLEPLISQSSPSLTAWVRIEILEAPSSTYGWSLMNGNGMTMR